MDDLQNKNPLFILDVISQLPIDNVRLLWVGDGELKRTMETKATEYGIEDKIILQVLLQIQKIIIRQWMFCYAFII